MVFIGGRLQKTWLKASCLTFKIVYLIKLKGPYSFFFRFCAELSVTFSSLIKKEYILTQCPLIAFALSFSRRLQNAAETSGESRAFHV